MKPPKCRLCEHEHWSREPHVFASNSVTPASNNASNGVNGDTQSNSASKANGLDTHRAAAQVDAKSVCRADEDGGRADGGSVAVGRKQRWPRDKYNAYQREYMSKRRKAKSE